MNAFLRTATAVVLSAWVWTALPAQARAEEPAWAQWRCVADLPLPASPGAGLVELPLPARVFALAKTDLGDLRLADPAGRALPYVLRVDQGTAAKSESYQPARMYNPVFLPGQQSSVCVDFGNRRPRTRVDVETPGTNFRRRVNIEGGPDGENWQVLQSAWLFRIADGGQSYDKSRVELPDNDFRYLRVRVFNAPDDPGQLTISRILGWWEKATPPQKVDVPVASVKTTEDAKARTTEIALDLEHENLPLSELTMDFKDANYLRQVEVLGRNRLMRTIEEPVEDRPSRRREIEEPWEHVTDGAVYRFPAGDGADAAVGNALALSRGYRYLLVRIRNGDNAPLSLAGVKVSRRQHYLALQPGKAGAYRLYVGNAQADAPQYDLAHFADRLRAQGIAPATLGPVGANPLFAVAPARPVPWSERYQWPLWGALLAVLAVLGTLVYRQARRIPPVG